MYIVVSGKCVVRVTLVVKASRETSTVVVENDDTADETEVGSEDKLEEENVDEDGKNEDEEEGTKLELEGNILEDDGDMLEDDIVG